MVQVAVCSRTFSRHPQLREALSALYSNVRFNDDGMSLKDEALILFLQGCERAIVALEPITATVLSALPELRVISKFGVGYNNLDLDTMRRLDVALGWQGGVNRRAVAELAIGFMIGLLRKIPAADHQSKAGNWSLKIGRQLSERTVGVIGCGFVGQDLSRLLSAFGCRILVNDIQDQSEFCVSIGARQVSLETLLAEAEIVTLHTPLDDTTRGLMNAERLAAMRQGALLINTARGNIIDENALKDALERGHLGGAAMDVFAQEPPEDMELLNLDTFVSTPHCGGSTEEAILAMGHAAIRGLSDNAVPKPGEHPK